MTHIPDDTVERAAKALYEVEFEHLKSYPKPPTEWAETDYGWTEFDRNKRRKMARVALEHSGALFLTEDEREALSRFLAYKPLADPDDDKGTWIARWTCIEAIRRKLG